MNKRTRELDAQTGWTPRQKNHLRRLMRSGAEIAYVVTDRHGRPANGGPSNREWQVRAGLVQKIDGPLKICTKNALHGTLQPHRWKGERVWLAGFVGELQREEDKIGCLHREIIGEIYPECALSESVGIRIGRRDHLSGADLSGADLSGAYLSCANLSGADLSGANLSGANLSRANLSCANLSWANLSCANLSGANLSCAYLSRADLSRANLSCANLSCADLSRANLSRADLSCADLSRANLSCANLSWANLSWANLSCANLSCANLSGAYRPNAKEVSELVEAGWENDSSGHLRRKGT